MVSEISEVEEDNVRLRSEIGGIKENLNLKRQSSEEINQKLAQLNQELDSRKTQLMNLITQEAQYKNIYQNAASSKESLQRRLKRTDEEEVLAQNQIKDLEAKESLAKEEL